MGAKCPIGAPRPCQCDVDPELRRKRQDPRQRRRVAADDHERKRNSSQGFDEQQASGVLVGGVSGQIHQIAVVRHERDIRMRPVGAPSTRAGSLDQLAREGTAS